MERDIKVMKEMHLKLMEFAQTYFTSDEDETYYFYIILYENLFDHN